MAHAQPQGDLQFCCPLGIMCTQRRSPVTRTLRARTMSVLTTAEPRVAIAPEETEAYHTLMARVGKRAGKIPPEVLVLHVLSCVPAHEWPTRVEAMDAVLRRLEAAKRDKLRLEVAAGRRQAARRVRHQAARVRLAARIARSCTQSTRSKAGAIAPTSSRTRWGSASTS